MKAKRCLYPYDEYVGYLQLRKDGRTQVNLRNPITGKRSLVLLSRYRMSVHLGRHLNATEQVDHIDEDFTNDSLENLQILSERENREKSLRFRHGMIIAQTEQKCAVCGMGFFSDRLRKICSIECRARALKDGRACKKRLDEKLIDEIKQLRCNGGTSYSIASKLGISRNTVMKHWNMDS